MRLRHKPWALPEMREDSKFFEKPIHLKGIWKEEFKNNHPIDLEIGCGRGDFIVEKARRNPERNFIALDLKNEVLVYALRKINDSELSNVRVISMKAEEILEVFGEDEISTIYLNFPNPWPKAGHNKRRLSHPRFLLRYREFTKDDTTIELKTDDEGLYMDSLEYFNEAGYKITYNSDDLEKDYKDNIATEYETKFRNFGMPIYRIDAIKMELPKEE